VNLGRTLQQRGSTVGLEPPTAIWFFFDIFEFDSSTSSSRVRRFFFDISTVLLQHFFNLFAIFLSISTSIKLRGCTTARRQR
jgi:hypothetical protein